jgi:hypothetical protein
VFFEADSNFAQFVLEEDENRAYGIVDEYGADYVILSQDLLYKSVSMAVYAYDTLNTSDPRMAGYFATMLGCSRISENDVVKYRCGNQEYNEETMESLPTRWQEKPNNVVKLPSGNGYANLRVTMYRSEAKNVLYIFSERSNNSMIVKLWMKKQSTLENFAEVYSAGQVKVFEIY